MPEQDPLQNLRYRIGLLLDDDPSSPAVDNFLEYHDYNGRDEEGRRNLSAFVDSEQDRKERLEMGH